MINREQLTNWQTTGQQVVAQWESYYQEHQSTVHTVGIVALAGATGTVIGLLLGKGIVVAKGVAVAKAGAAQMTTSLEPATTGATVKGAVTLLGNTASQGAALVDKVAALFNTISANAIPLTAGAVGGGAVGVGVIRSQVRRTKEKLNEQVAQTAAAQAEVARMQDELNNAATNLAALQGSVAPPPAPTPDRLEDIRGIGQVIAQRLNAAGINTFAELAAQTPAQLRTIIGAGRAASMMNPEAWIAVARQRVAASSSTPSAASEPPAEAS